MQAAPKRLQAIRMANSTLTIKGVLPLSSVISLSGFLRLFGPPEDIRCFHDERVFPPQEVNTHAIRMEG